jgi:hypothetical protein
MGNATREWSDQAWLMSHWKESFQSPTSTKKVVYRDEAETNATIKNFLSLNTRQLSLLQPFIEISKLVKGEKTTSYPITQLLMDVDKIAEQKKKLEYVVASSVELSRKEKMKFDVDITFTLEFLCSSFSAFTKKRGKDKVALVDFIKRPSNFNAPEDVTYPMDNTILLEIGWSNPSGKYLQGLVNGGFLKKKERTALLNFSKNSKYKVVGSLLRNSITVETTGEIKVSVEFKGRMASYFEDPRANLLLGKNTKLFKEIEKLQKKAQDPKIKREDKAIIDAEITSTMKKHTETVFRDVLADLTAKGQLKKITVEGAEIDKYFKLTDEYFKNERKEQQDLRTYYNKNFTDPDLTYNPEADNPGLLKFCAGQPVIVKAASANAPPPSGSQGVPQRDAETGTRPPKDVYYVHAHNIITYMCKNFFDKIKIFDGVDLEKIEIGDFLMSVVTGKTTYIGEAGKVEKQTLQISIGAIPVSLNTFQEWFVAFISGQGKTMITLKDFLYYMTQKLIQMAFRKPKGVRAFPQLYFPKYQLFEIGEPAGSAVRATMLNYSPTAGAGNLPKVVLGGGQQVVRDVKFNQATIKGLKSAFADPHAFKITGIARDVYNCTVELYGAPFFENGTFIIIDPLKLLDDNSSTSNNRSSDTASALKQLGIGGTYLIISVNTSWSKGGYFTTLDCKYQGPLPAEQQSIKIEKKFQGK